MRSAKFNEITEYNSRTHLAQRGIEKFLNQIKIDKDYLCFAIIEMRNEKAANLRQERIRNQLRMRFNG